MRLFFAIASVLGLVAFCGCATNGPDATKPLEQPARGALYVQQSSQFHFPALIGGFGRDKVTQYDRSGRDISVGYNHEGLQIAMTVYVYPVVQKSLESTLDGHFKQCETEVSRAHPGTRLVSEGSVQIAPGGQPHEGMHAEFSYSDLFAGRRQELGSEVYLFAEGRWFVLYRVTYPIGQQAAAQKEIRSFLDELTWP